MFNNKAIFISLAILLLLKLCLGDPHLRTWFRFCLGGMYTVFLNDIVTKGTGIKGQRRKTRED